MSNSDTLLSGEEGDEEASTPRMGVLLCGKLAYVLKTARMFSPDHDRARGAASDLVELVEEQLDKSGDDALTVTFGEQTVSLGDRRLEINNRQQERVDILRDRLERLELNAVELGRALSVDSVLSFADHLLDDDPVPERLSTEGLDAFRADPDAGDSTRHLIKDEKETILRLYATFLVRCRNYYAAIREDRRPRTANLKRNIQRIVDRLPDRKLVFAGLAALNLAGRNTFAHGANRAIYAMVLADAVGLDAPEIARCGLAALTPDFSAVDDEERPGDLEAGDDEHFERNLASVMESTRRGGRDVLSALQVVTGYERGIPVGDSFPSRWYDDYDDPHLITRLLAVARDYDLLVRGIGDIESVTPDIALQILMEQTKSVYDTGLVKLFIDTLGLYPVGSVVELSDGRRAFVVRPPDELDPDSPFRAMRPDVRPLETPDEVLELSDEAHEELTIERILAPRELPTDTRPDVRWLF